MNKVGMLVMGGLLTLFVAGSAFGQESGVTRKEVDALKTKIERLEKAIEIQNVPSLESQEERHWYDRIDLGSRWVA